MNTAAYVYIPDELRAKIPALYATERNPDATAWVRLFTPDSSWTWYVVEYDGDDTCFGYVEGHAKELGYFLLSDIACARGRLGLPVERDLFFTPRPLFEVRARHERRGT